LLLAATSTLDQVNLVLCYIARERYKVPRTIARVNNPSNAWLFNENFHVDVAVNQAEITAALIGEEMSLGDMVTLVKIRRGNYAVVEEKVMDGARAIGVEIRNLGLPEDCVLAAIVREGKVIIPRGVTAIETGDEVIAITDPAGAHFLEDLLSGMGGN
jgi:trk system potassium uptake protein